MKTIEETEKMSPEEKRHCFDSIMSNLIDWRYKMYVNGESINPVIPDSVCSALRILFPRGL